MCPHCKTQLTTNVGQMFSATPDSIVADMILQCPGCQAIWKSTTELTCVVEPQTEATPA